jgi:hypothetical protein
MFMRRMMFATFLIPGARHYVELIHPYRRFESCGVTRIEALLYDRAGRELATVSLPLEKTVVDLSSIFPETDESALVLTDVAYSMSGKKHPYQYGFLYQAQPQATPVHYPLDIALGLTNAINYFPNHGYFPLGSLPPWLHIRLYLGNVSEHEAIEPEVTLAAGQEKRSFPVCLPPLAHRLIDLPEQGAQPVDYLTVAGEAKPICYVAGVDTRNGALTFLEHLMQTFKPDAEEGDLGNVPEPETVLREA